MPQNTRRPNARQRAQRRRRQEAAPDPQAVAQPVTGTPDPPVATPKPAPRARPETSWAAAPRASAARPASPAQRNARSRVAEMPLLKKELLHIGVLAVGLFATLIVLAFIFR